MIEGDELAFKIREFQYPQDYPAVIALWEVSGPGVSPGRSDTPEETQKKLGRDPNLFLVAEVDDCIVGTVMGGFDGRRGLVYHLAVVREYRGKGLGDALMDAVESRLKDKGCIRAYLLIAHDNGGVVDFYKRRAWETMDLTIMAKDL